MQLNSSSDLEAHVDVDLDCDEGAVHNYSSISLDESAIAPSSSILVMARIQALKSRSGSMESLNVSTQLPQNFNFSACNTSSINLIGASGAVPSIQKLRRNKIIMEDELTGYCVMAPIISRKIDSQETTTATTSSTTSSTTSGYSTGSYCSSSSSSSSTNTQANENKDLPQEFLRKPPLRNLTAAAGENDYDEVPLRKTPLPVTEADASKIYENMQSGAGSPLNGSSVILRNHENITPLGKDFTGNLYENLLTIKAAQELELPLTGQICTSTPTDSPADKETPNGLEEEQENFYQTPRKSIISVDDKIPSYYPNSCDTVKTRRRSNSPSKQTSPTSHKSAEKEKTCANNTMGFKHLVNIKMKRERKENLYISSPQKILEQRKKSATTTSSSANIGASKSKKSANAQKISENVYAVNLSSRKSLQLNNNNSHYNNNINESTTYNEITETAQLKEKLHNELLQLALLQNIDFKFDDMSSAANATSNVMASSNSTPSANTPPTQSGIAKLEQAELEYESCYQASKEATRMLHKYATLAPQQSMRIKQQLQHHLQLNQSSNQNHLMTQSTKLESPVTSSDLASANAVMGSKKFASLPRFKKIDFSPLKLKINNVLQRNQTPDF